MLKNKIVPIMLIAALPLSAELSVKNIEKMVQDIKAKRVGKIKDHNLSSSPFVVLQQDTNTSTKVSVAMPEEKDEFVLGAIINSTAFIDGSWHKQGDKIDNFKVDVVADDYVVLKKKNRTITLFFKRAKNLIKIGKE